MAVKFAKSKAGHDKGHYYVIVKEEEEYVYLADGALKTVEKPKKKNKKHIQAIKKIPREAAELLPDHGEPGNLEIKRALKIYCKSLVSMGTDVACSQGKGSGH